MNQQQIEGIIRWLLATGGPLGSMLISKGASADTLNQITAIALAVVPPLIALVWGQIRKTDKQLLGAASKVAGAEVHVDTSVSLATGQPVASPGAIAAVNDNKLPNVVAKAA